METFEDVILYSQIGFGFMFFIYVVTNFGPLLLKNMKVSKIVYQSRVFPFFIFRIGGLVIFGFIILSANFLSYYQAMAGYYNYIGDIFFIENRLDLAEEYYTEASVYEYQNHRSNYAMATLARLKRNKYDEAYYFDNACLKQPTEFSYVNLSNVFLHNDQYFDGLFKLKDAMEEFPNSYHILNNMGYYYSRTDISDSAFYYFEMSNNAKWKSAVPASNIYGLLAKANIDIPIDSLEARYDTEENFSGKANKLAMHNQFGSLNNQKQSIEIEDNYSKSYFAYLYNTGLHSIRSDNTKFYQDMQAYADSSGSDLYKNRIAVLTSFNRYFNHQVTESLRLLYELGEMSLLNDEYFNILGILALDLNSPRLAMDYFQRTSIQENEKYRLNLALAYAEAGLIKYSRELFETIVQSSDASIQALSKAYLSVLDLGNIDQIDTLNDEQKYLLYRYRYKKNDPVMSEKLLASVENNMIKTLIQIENVEFLLQEGKDKEAFEYFTNTNIASSGSPLATRINKLKYLSAINGKTDGTELNNPGNIDSSNPLYLYDQLLNLKMNYDASDTVLMDSIYNILATWNPFFEEGVIAAVNYFDEARNMDNYSYNMLFNALTVNTYSIILNKYYIAYCINDGLVDFARNRLEFIGNFMNGESFEEYHKTTLLEINQKEAAMNVWGN
jgi:Tfp pilus assembly protein PilF